MRRKGMPGCIEESLDQIGCYGLIGIAPDRAAGVESAGDHPNDYIIAYMVEARRYPVSTGCLVIGSRA